MRCSAELPCTRVRTPFCAVDRLAARVRRGFQKPARDRLVALDHRRGLGAAHMAMDVDGEPFAAGMRAAPESGREFARRSGRQVNSIWELLLMLEFAVAASPAQRDYRFM